MTATTRPVPLDAAIRKADRHYRSLDAHRDRATMLREIRRMDAGGATRQDTADRVGMSERSIVRLLDESPPIPPPLSTFDLSEPHCRRLEATATIAADLACRLRDDDPRITWDALGRLDRDALQELAVVLLAAMPIDAQLTQTFGWVIALDTKVAPR